MQLAKSLGLASGWCFEREGNWRNQNPTAPRIAPDLNRTTTLRIRVVPPGTELHKLQHTKPLPHPYSHPHCIHRIVLHRTADIKHGGGGRKVYVRYVAGVKLKWQVMTSPSDRADANESRKLGLKKETYVGGHRWEQRKECQKKIRR